MVGSIVTIGGIDVSVTAIVGVTVGSMIFSSVGFMVFVGCWIGSVLVQALRIIDINKKANIKDLISFFIYNAP
jgi:hypothetical protein